MLADKFLKKRDTQPGKGINPWTHRVAKIQMDTRVITVLPADSGQGQTRSPTFSLPERGDGTSPHKLSSPTLRTLTSQGKRTPDLRRARSLLAWLVFSNCIFLSWTTRLFCRPRKEGAAQWQAYLLHFPSRFHSWQIMNYVFFNICICFIRNTINLKRKQIKVFKWSPNILHAHLKIWKHIAWSHRKLFLLCWYQNLAYLGWL